MCKVKLQFFFLVVSIVNETHIPKETQVARELAAHRRDTIKNATIYTKCGIKTWGRIRNHLYLKMTPFPFPFL